MELVEKGKIKSCKVLDVGCGEGFYSIYLASKGFDVLGIDISEKAIRYARENAKKASVDIRFITMDLNDLSELKEKFDFVLEWGFMHHVMPPQREKYVKDVSNILNEGGKYLSVCFNEKSPEFGGPGKGYRISPVDTKLYYSSQNELKELFSSYFKIIEAKLITITGREKGNKHIANYFFMKN